MITKLNSLNLIAHRQVRNSWKIYIKETPEDKVKDVYANTDLLGVIEVGTITDFIGADEQISLEFLSEVLALGILITRLELEESRRSR